MLVNNMATEPIVEDLENLMEQCNTDSETFDGVLAALPVSEEEAIALRYLNLRHASYELIGLNLGYEIAYMNLDHLSTAIEHENLQAYQRRHRRMLGLPMEEDYRVQLKLVEDAPFRERIFDIYKSKIWPILQQSIA